MHRFNYACTLFTVAVAIGLSGPLLAAFVLSKPWSMVCAAWKRLEGIQL